MEASKPDYPKIPDQEYQKPDSGIIHIIKFQLPEHQEELDIHMRAWKYRAAAAWRPIYAPINCFTVPTSPLSGLLQEYEAFIRSGGVV